VTEAANQKREQTMAENEIKRQKMLVDTTAAVLKEKLQADLKKDLEFQQIQQKERDRAVAAQQKLRKLTGQELEERIHLERELAKCQQQNLLLQNKVKSIDWRPRQTEGFSNRGWRSWRSRYPKQPRPQRQGKLRKWGML